MTGKKKVNDYSYINRAMKFKTNYSNNKLVCITNTKEVLRITRELAKKYFFKEISASDKELDTKKALGFEVDYKDREGSGVWLKPIDGWYYTTKKVYKQYTASLVPNSIIPKPEFTFKSKKDKTEAKNIFLQWR